MTNLDVHPDEMICEAAVHAEVELITPRNVPLGGVRAMTVRRTLPARGRPFIGPWCFVDHYGPDEIAQTGGMNVPPHPHCGLATVSWLFRGEIEHRDSLGTRALVLPGEVNLMTAGHGIAHSEVSTRASTILHGVQLWVALPEHRRSMPATFAHYAAPEMTEAGVSRRVFLGSLDGETSPVLTESPLVGAEFTFAAGAITELALNPEFEHGVLIDTGTVTVDGHPSDAPNLLALPSGRRTVTITAGEGPARILFIGGAPMESDLVMWWNFVGGSHDEIVEARRDWQVEMGFDDGASESRYGRVLGYDGTPLRAPQMPGGRLRARKS